MGGARPWGEGHSQNQAPPPSIQLCRAPAPVLSQSLLTDLMTRALSFPPTIRGLQGQWVGLPNVGHMTRNPQLSQVSEPLRSDIPSRCLWPHYSISYAPVSPPVKWGEVFLLLMLLASL